MKWWLIIIPEQSTVKAHSALFAGRGEAKNERLLFQSTIDLHILNIFQLTVTVNIHLQNMCYCCLYLCCFPLCCYKSAKVRTLCVYIFKVKNNIFENKNYEHRRIEFIFLVQYINSYSVFRVLLLPSYRIVRYFFGLFYWFLRGHRSQVLRHNLWLHARYHGCKWITR